LHFLSVEPEESEESEEDPDDEPNMLQYIRGSKPRNPSVVLEPVATRASSTQTKQNASQDQDREVKTTHDLNPDDYGMQIVDPLADMSSSFGGYATVARSSHVAGPRTRSQSRPRQQPPNAPDMSIKNHTTKPGEIIRVYMVSKIDNDDELQFIGEIFSDRDEANHFAELQVQEYRKKRTKPSSIKEEYSEGLYTGIVAHGGRGGTTTISVSSQIKQTTNLPDVTHIQPRLPERSYLIIRTIKNSVFDSENSSTTVTVTSEPLEGMHFSDREYANNEAAKHLTQFLKPKKPNLDHIESYDNQVCPQIRDLLKSCDEAGNCFIIEVEKGDGGPPWLDVDSVEVEVKLFHMKGP
jgi:hypothetical protein